MFSNRISLKSLALVCRALGTMLHSGVDIQRAFQLAAGKTGDSRCRAAMGEIRVAVGSGDDVSSAMRAQGDAFPELMIEMVDVAEQTGALPEILAGLADHFENNLRLRRDFLVSIAWPVFQLVMSILVIAAVLAILGWIASAQGGEPLDVLGWGLTGTSGALTWLMYSFGSIFALFVVYQLLSRSLLGKKFLHPFLMLIPAVGYCMRSFAIARFSWAFALTQQAGMPIDRSLEASLKATSNGAYVATIPQVWSMVSRGDTLSAALEETGRFPKDFLEMVHVAETSGTVPEMLERLGPQFEDQARRSLQALVGVLSWTVWLVVAMFIIFVIFSIVFWYIGMLNSALQNV